MVFVNYIYDMVVDTQFNKFFSRQAVRACSICIPDERYRSVTALDATRVTTVIQGHSPLIAAAIIVIVTDTYSTV